MSLDSRTLRDLEEYYSQYAEARTPLEQDQILEAVKKLYGANQAISLMRSVRVKRKYYTPPEEPIQRYA